MIRQRRKRNSLRRRKWLQVIIPRHRGPQPQLRFKKRTLNPKFLFPSQGSKKITICWWRKDSPAKCTMLNLAKTSLRWKTDGLEVHNSQMMISIKQLLWLPFRKNLGNEILLYKLFLRNRNIFKEIHWFAFIKEFSLIKLMDIFDN
jgi:hypothetical protein